MILKGGMICQKVTCYLYGCHGNLVIKLKAENNIGALVSLPDLMS